MSTYILHDDDWKMTERYNEWSHDEILLWFQGLNDSGFYSDYEDAFKESEVDGNDFENMTHVPFLQERFNMEDSVAYQLADVVQQRVERHSALKRETSQLTTRSIKMPSSEPMQSVREDSQFNPLPQSLIGVIQATIKCKCCDNVHLHEQKLYQCTEEECTGTKSGQILCRKCFDVYHNIIFQRRHQFDMFNHDIICVNDMLESVRRNSNYERGVGRFDKVQMKRFQRFNKIQHFFGSITSVFTAGFGEANVYMTYSAEMMASLTGMTGELVVSALGTALLGGGAGAVLSFGIELGVIFWRYYHGKIETPRELIRLIGKSFVGHGVAFVGFMGGCIGTTMACGRIGASLGGVFGGPVGLGIGAGVGIVIGIIVGLASRWKVNKIYDNVFESQEKRIDLAQTSLDFFHFGKDMSVIENEEVFNKKEINRRYHGFALLYHPDRNLNKTDIEKKQMNVLWAQLCSYYGILIAMCNERNTVNVQPENNINEEHLSLLDH